MRSGNGGKGPVLCLTSAPVCRDGAGGREAPAERRRLHQHQPHSLPKQHAALPRQGQRGHQEHVRELQHRFGQSAVVSAVPQAAGQVHAPVFLHLSVFRCRSLRQRLVRRCERQLRVQHQPQQPVHHVQPLPVRSGGIRI